MPQIMLLLDLAPDIQEQILFLPRIQHARDSFEETDIHPISRTLDWRKQRRMPKELERDVNSCQSMT